MSDADGDTTVTGADAGVRINVRCSNGLKVAVRAALDSTVGEFKTLVAQNCDTPANQQRLIYKGRILKDDQTLDSYGLQDEHTVHLVRGFAPDAPATNASTPAPGGQNTTPDISRGVSSNDNQGLGGGLLSSLFPGMDVSALGGSGASGLFGDALPNLEQMQQQMQQQITRNPSMISEMMNMPAIQNMLNNPDIIRNVMMNNPQIREVIDRNPELAHILNDPNSLRQTMETARNPELMREMMRNTDRAMSNIESLPEGFNMLRRMYENVQEPLLNATSMTGDSGSGPGSNPFASLLGSQVGGQNQNQTTPTTVSSDANGGSSVPNANPLPNPWSSAADRGAQTNNTTTNRAGGTNIPGTAGFGIPGLSGMDTQSSGLIDPAAMLQLLQNPAMSQMMNQMFDSNPQVREAMQNSESLLGQMPSAERLQQAMASLSSLFGPQSQSPLGAGQTASGPAVPPEELYANQLSQLQEMGFIDTRENIQALLATSGNVHAAVERLLQNLG